MQALTQEGQQMVHSMAARHNVSSDAVHHLLLAIAAGGGSQAQFNHPELGGMGQWSQGGMIMVGDMFNQALKYRVDALCNDLAGALGAAWPFAPSLPQGHSPQGQSGGFGSRWPAELGAPSSSGSQNSLHYAVFPATRRLAIDQGGQISIYDTGDHQIGGVSQQQGGDQSLTFTSQYGMVRLCDLPLCPAGGQFSPAGGMAPSPMADPPAPRPYAEAPLPDAPLTEAPAPYHAPSSAPSSPSAGMADDEIFSRLERLAELCQKGVITQEEFAAKKAELLARL